MADLTKDFDPRERVLRFHFGGGDCLYRDQLDRRVIADVEGCGRFKIRATASITTEVDGDSFSLLEGQFVRYLTVHCESEGECDVSVHLYPHELPTGDTKLRQEWDSAGVVVCSSTSVEVDRGHEFITAPSQDWPIPFRLALRSSEPVEVLSRQVTARLLQEFSLEDSRALERVGWRVQGISKIVELESAFTDGSLLRAPVAGHLNTATWTCRVSAHCKGLLVRKLYDRFHGRQRARVLVDGEPMGWWYEPRQDRVRRWAVADFGIPTEFFSGRDEVQIAIDPPGGAPLWSLSKVQVFGFFRE